MKELPVLGLLVLASVGCTVVPAGRPGDKPSDVPPRIVDKGNEGRLWDNPSAFGPVPANLQTKGDMICKLGGFDRAAGYHPKARDYEGKEFPEGGFFCEGSR